MTEEHTSEAAISWIEGQTRYQISASFLSKIIRNSDTLKLHLRSIGADASDNKRIENLQQLSQTLSQRAVWIKRVNMVLLFVGVVLLISGVVWPLIAAEWMSLDSGLIVGFTETALLILGGAAIFQYRSWKTDQISIEDALRQTLFRRELLDEKVARLNALLRRSRKLRVFRKVDRGDPVNSIWDFSEIEPIKKRIETIIDTQFQPHEAAALTTVLKDISIKGNSFVYAVRFYEILAVVTILFGLALPIILFLASSFSPGFGLTAVRGAGYQSLLVVGLGGLFLSLRKQFQEKLDGLQQAIYSLTYEPSDVRGKIDGAIASLRAVDASWSGGNEAV